MPKFNPKKVTSWPEDDAPFPEAPDMYKEPQDDHELLHEDDTLELRTSSIETSLSPTKVIEEDHIDNHSPAMSISERAMNMRNGQFPWMQGLNEEQRKAVETLDGPVLVLAGAGTGKTRVLTTRIAHILAIGSTYPSQVLAVTFTNKAAREMKERIGHMVGNVVEGMPWLGTFHSIATRILRRHAELVGLRSDFTILDMDDQIRLLKQLIQAENIDEKRWPARQLASHIDGWKNRGLTPDKVPESSNVFANGKGISLFKAYQQRLKILNAADFGDLLVECLRLFQENPDILTDYHRRFRYILVDEYQDTNIAQYLWLRLLTQGQTNICCVGDDDQSIYGWRGAEVDNILRFEKDFPGAITIRLERNYRSSAPILAAASHLIRHNESRLGKTLFTDTQEPDAEKVKAALAWDSEEEARAIGDEIEALQTKGHSLDQIAILVRASFQMREFEDRFVTLGLNYRVIGGPRFYERREIRDAMAYFRATIQPADDLAFERIVNVPKRGIGTTSIQKLHAYARDQHLPLMQAATDLIDTEELPARTRTALRTLLEHFTRWRQERDHTPHTDLAEMILDESGYTTMWQNDRSADAPGRLDNLKELIRSMEEFDTMGGFLEHVSLVMDSDNKDGQDAINLMTLHSAKGLEFDTVFLPGWEEGLFPHQRALDEGGQAALEEERRLAYVGITRARHRAQIWFASNRRIHGLWQSSTPSRFLDELPASEVEIIDTSSNYGGYGVSGFGNPTTNRFDQADPFSSTYSTPGWQRAQQSRKKNTHHSPPTATIIDGELVAKGITETKSLYAIGERVFHQKFGYGTIATMEGNKFTIDFEKAGRKKVLESFIERH